jgi:hypothetical protein
MVVPLALTACENQECEQARLELARTWQELRDTATSRQQIPEQSDLSESEQKDRIATWTEIEARAELLRSSFGTSQVTWSPAQKARTELGEIFTPAVSGQDPVSAGFATMLGKADERMAAFDKRCR